MAGRVEEKHKLEKGKGTQRLIDEKEKAREQVADQKVGASASDPVPSQRCFRSTCQKRVA